MTKNNSKLGTEPYKGVRDFFPEDQALQNYIFNVWHSVSKKYGYVEYNCSILEPSEIYKAKSGDEIVNEETYTFIDRGDREVTLRPEMTPSVARMVAARKRELGYPARWYSVQNFFRYQRQQRGRLREFWQLNADIFGANGIEADIEIISLAYDIMKAFGAKDSDFDIKISSRKLMNAVFNNWFELDESKAKALQKLIDKKDKIDPEVFAEEAEKIVGEPFEFLNMSKGSQDYEEAMAFTEIRVAKEELDQVLEALQARGIKNIKFEETIVRGFDYYTGIVFEVFDTNPENKRALFGGGRYDDLLSLFSDEKVSAVGFGMGDVTIKDFLQVRDLLPAYVSSTAAMICILDIDSLQYAEEVAKELRSEDLNVALNYTYKSLGDQIKSAEKQNIPYIIAIGADEVSTKSYKIKELSTGDIVDEIKNKEIQK